MKKKKIGIKKTNKLKEEAGRRVKVVVKRC